MNELGAGTLKGWLLSARPAPDENKIHLGGFMLAILNLLLVFFGRVAPAGGIGIADRYPCEAVSLMPTYALIIPLLTPLIALALLAIRRYFKSRLSYYACNTLIWLCSLSALLVVCWDCYIINYILENFQPLH